MRCEKGSIYRVRASMSHHSKLTDDINKSFVCDIQPVS